MARGVGRLSALAVSRLREPGLYGDGGGLYLQVTNTDSRSWIYRFTLNGRARSMGLGPLHTITLADARSRAAECRRLAFDGIDPIEHRNADRERERIGAPKAITFDACAEAYVERHKTGWRNGKHANQWKGSLDTYARPILGAVSVQLIDVGLVMQVLDPIWSTKTETASRVRGRIEAVLDWATSRGYRKGENPARWRGHLQNLLPKPSRVQRVEHFPALPYQRAAAFMADLRKQHGVGALALEFAILTAARSGEVIGATWAELNLAEAIWTIPAERMKALKEHRVPLSAPALQIVERTKMADNPFVFPGQKSDRPLSPMAMLRVVKELGLLDTTVHGFRSTFRDWASETTNFPTEVVEMALAHAVSDKVEAAYRRGDLFQKRRALMDDWAMYCSY